MATILSVFPRRWHDALPLSEALPWERGAILSGLLESVASVALLVDWYSRSVSTWAASALDSALRGGPENQVPGQAIGFAAFVLWLLHPQTWLFVYFALEGVVRLLAASATEQVFCTLPLGFLDWCFGKLTSRPPEGDALHNPGARAHVQSFTAVVREKLLLSRVPQTTDELVELTESGEAFVEIHSSRPKPDWVPPKTVRIGDSYFRLERATQVSPPRPFIFRLRPLPAGVPGRTVIVYSPPPKA